ncbi:MAG: hypothetical protein A2551_00090 [Elusimicrobia bacterium RIFOXYD2_FULL_34_30]|nr:MAG: hypothetical protein A2551_00090 [Elusimicrobia bacterium RIFOXYD2_FULL_34_30]
MPISVSIVTRSSYSVELDWQPNGNPEPGTSYIVSCSTDSNFSAEINANPSTSTYIIPNLDAYTLYYFKVRSINNDSIINQTYETILTTTTLVAPPVIVGSFTGNAISSTTILWSWIDTNLGSTQEDGYYLKTSTDWLVVSLGQNDTAHQETYLTPNTEYSRYIEAYNINGSSKSSILSVYTLAVAPTNLIFTNIGYSSTTLQWDVNDNPGTTKFGISRALDSNFTTSVSTFVVFTSNLTGNTTTVFNLNPETQYYFRVWAYNEEQTGTTYTQSSTTTGPSPVNAPSGLTVSLLGTTSIQWQFIDNATNETDLYISSGADVSMRLSENLGPVSGIGGTTYWWETTGLSPNTQYTRYVEAKNGSGTIWSTAITTYTAANKPGNPWIFETSSSTIWLWWNQQNNSIDTAFDVEKSLDNSNFELIETISFAVDTANYIVETLSPNTTYYLRVRAKNGDGIYTEYSETISTKTLSAPIGPDITLPVIAILDPSGSSYKNSLLTISGTAEDNVEVSLVNISIFDLNNPPNYWNGSAWQTSEYWLDCTVNQSSWTYTSLPDWSDSGQYQLVAKVKDSSENWSTEYSTITFMFDVTAPSSTVLTPTNSSTISNLTTISGTAYDNTYLSAVELTIRRLSDGLYWTGSEWGSLAWLDTTNGSPWSYTGLLTANLTLGTSYWIISRGHDNAGNVESITIGSSIFTYITNSTQLQILAHGETNLQGSGKTGTPSTQTAGISFTITVNAVNSSYYVDSNASTSITVTTSDSYDTEPAGKSLVNGTETFDITPLTAQNIIITAVGSGLTNGSVTIPVSANSSSKLQIILPGETSVPGSSLGKTGTPATQTSGASFNITVNSCDAYWNLTLSTITTVSLTTFDSSDAEPANKQLINGTTTFAITLVSVGITSMTATDIGSILTPCISSALTVSAKSLPTAPSNLTAGDITSTSIKWMWTDNATNEDGYYIKSSTDGLLTSLSADSNSWSETGLSINKKYSRYIETYNNGGKSSSTILSKYTLTNLPSNFITTVKDYNYITLEWLANSNPEKTLYELYSSTDNVTFTLVVSTDATSYMNSNLSQLTTYYYKLYSVNGDSVKTGPVELIVQTLNSVVKGPISGKVTQSNGQAITGVSVQLLNNEGNTKISEVFTGTDGTYQFTDIADGIYQLVCSWYVNEIESIVYKNDIPENTTEILFTLEINYQLAQLAGKITLGTRANLSGKFAPAQQPYIELLHHGKVIAKINSDSNGNYIIPNLLPGKYMARAFNGVQMSIPSEVKVSEGEKQTLNFVWPLELLDTEVYAYPNPTKIGSIKIRYSVLNTNHSASMRIYNLAGELVREVKDNEITKTAPKYEFNWNLKNDDDDAVASGTYIYILELKELSSGEKAKTIKKIAVIK